MSLRPETFAGSPARAHIDLFLSAYLSASDAQHVLDVGCGRGDNLHFLPAADLHSYLGIDLLARPEWVTWMRQGPQIRFAAEDIQQIRGLRREHYDLALAITSFEHIHEDAVALRVMASALRPGGRALVVVPNHLSFLVYYIHGFRRYDRRTLHDLATDAGLRPIAHRSLGGLPSFLFHLFWFWTPILLLRFCRIVTFGRLSPARRQAFRELRARWSAHPAGRRIHTRILRTLVRLDRMIPVCRTMEAIEMEKPPPTGARLTPSLAAAHLLREGGG